MEVSKHPIYKAFFNSANIFNMSKATLSPKQRAAILREKLHICDLAAAQMVVANEQLEKEFPEWIQDHKERYFITPFSEGTRAFWMPERKRIIRLIENLEKS